MIEELSLHRWDAAIAKWFERDSAALRLLILDASLSPPDFAREFLADIVEGKVSRGKGGRPSERDGWVERAIVAEVFAEWDAAEALTRCDRSDTPKDCALALVANRRNISTDAVRGLVDKLKKCGITREKWRTWGRPDWKHR